MVRISNKLGTVIIVYKPLSTDLSFLNLLLSNKLSTRFESGGQSLILDRSVESLTLNQAIVIATLRLFSLCKTATRSRYLP